MIVGIELSDGTLRAVRMEHFRPGRAPESIADIAYTPPFRAAFRRRKRSRL